MGSTYDMGKSNTTISKISMQYDKKLKGKKTFVQVKWNEIKEKQMSIHPNRSNHVTLQNSTLLYTPTPPQRLSNFQLLVPHETKNIEMKKKKKLLFLFGSKKNYK